MSKKSVASVTTVIDGEKSVERFGSYEEASARASVLADLIYEESQMEGGPIKATVSLRHRGKTETYLSIPTGMKKNPRKPRPTLEEKTLRRGTRVQLKYVGSRPPFYEDTSYGTVISPSPAILPTARVSFDINPNNPRDVHKSMLYRTTKKRKRFNAKRRNPEDIYKRMKSLGHGLYIGYLPANQAWILTWYNHPLGIFEKKKLAMDEAKRLQRGIKKNPMWHLYQVAFKSPAFGGKLVELGQVYGPDMTISQAKDKAAKDFKVQRSAVRVREPHSGNEKWR